MVTVDDRHADPKSEVCFRWIAAHWPHAGWRVEMTAKRRANL